MNPASDRVFAVGAIPVRALAPHPRAPAVLFLHGFGVSKDTHLKEARSLADAGFAAVLPDAPQHGARRGPLVDALHAASGVDAHRILLQLVTAAVAEIPLLVDHLLDDGHPSVAIAGISMGAFTALGAAAIEPRLSPIVSILGSPDWAPPGADVPADLEAVVATDPRHRAEAFAPRPLLLLNAGEDRSVPPAPARAFAEALRASYRGAAERLVHREYPHSDHFVREEDWEDLWRTTLEFLTRFARGAP